MHGRVGLTGGHVCCSVDHFGVWNAELVRVKRTSRRSASEFHHGHTPRVVGIHVLGLLRLLLLSLAWVESLRHALASHKIGVLTDDVVEGMSTHGVHSRSLSHDLSVGRHVHLLHAIALVPMPGGIGVVAAHDLRGAGGHPCKACRCRGRGTSEMGLLRAAAVKDVEGLGRAKQPAVFRACRRVAQTWQDGSLSFPARVRGDGRGGVQWVKIWNFTVCVTSNRRIERPKTLLEWKVRARPR